MGPRRAAAALLAQMAFQTGNTAVIRCFSDLMEIASDSDPIAACTAASAATVISRADPALTLDWLRLLERSPHGLVRHIAALELGCIGRAGQDRVLLPLMRGLLDSDHYARFGAAWGLGLTRAPAAVPALIACLGSRESEISRTACRALPGFGKAAASAVPALLALARSRSNVCGNLPVVALGRLGAKRSRGSS
jgi:HEAT repeat protein